MYVIVQHCHLMSPLPCTLEFSVTSHFQFITTGTDLHEYQTKQFQLFKRQDLLETFLDPLDEIFN